MVGGFEPDSLAYFNRNMQNDFNLNISRYVSTAVGEAEIDLDAVHAELVEVEKAIMDAKKRHNRFLKELGLKPLP